MNGNDKKTLYNLATLEMRIDKLKRECYLDNQSIILLLFITMLIIYFEYFINFFLFQEIFRISGNIYVVFNIIFFIKIIVIILIIGYFYRWVIVNQLTKNKFEIFEIKKISQFLLIDEFNEKLIDNVFEEYEIKDNYIKIRDEIDKKYEILRDKKIEWNKIIPFGTISVIFIKILNEYYKKSYELDMRNNVEILLKNSIIFIVILIFLVGVPLTIKFFINKQIFSRVRKLEEINLMYECLERLNKK